MPGRLLVLDRFYDLDKWIVKVLGGDVVETKFGVRNEQYYMFERSWLRVKHADTSSGQAYLYRRLLRSINKFAVSITFSTSSTPPSGSYLNIVVLGTYNSVDDDVDGKIFVRIDENGNAVLQYLSGGSSKVVSSNVVVNDGKIHNIVLYKDGSNIRMIIDFRNAIEVNDSDDVVIDSIALGHTGTAAWTWQIDVDLIMVHDDILSYDVGINGLSMYYHSHPYSSILKHYAIGYYDSSGNTFVDIYDKDMNKVKTIDLGETVDSNDYHSTVEPFYIVRNNKLLLIVLIGRHHDTITYVEIDPLNDYNIVRKKNLPAGTYPYLMFLGDKLYVLYRKDTDNGYPLAIYDVEDDQDTILVSTDNSDQYVYPLWSGVNSVNGRYALVLYTLFDSNVKYREDVRALIYRDGKWYYPNGSEIPSFPIPYRDPNAVLFSVYSNAGMDRDKILVVSGFPCEHDSFTCRWVGDNIVCSMDNTDKEKRIGWLVRYKNNDVYAIRPKYAGDHVPYILNVYGREFIVPYVVDIIFGNDKVLVITDDRSAFKKHIKVFNIQNIDSDEELIRSDVLVGSSTEGMILNGKIESIKLVLNGNEYNIKLLGEPITIPLPPGTYNYTIYKYNIKIKEGTITIPKKEEKKIVFL